MIMQSSRLCFSGNFIKGLTEIAIGVNGNAPEVGGEDMIGKTIHELAVGDSAQFSKTVTETDVYLFAGVTGDFNPAHIDEDYSRKTYFGTRIAHGLLSAGFISAVLGTRLPGPGTVYLRQELTFLGAVKIGDTITARVEITEIDAAKGRVKLLTTCDNQEGKRVLTGEAVVSPPRAPKAAA
jgi:3-hydroxybutyryl-CoA dehydratase